MGSASPCDVCRESDPGLRATGGEIKPRTPGGPVDPGFIGVELMIHQN